MSKATQPQSSAREMVSPTVFLLVKDKRVREEMNRTAHRAGYDVVVCHEQQELFSQYRPDHVGCLVLELLAVEDEQRVLIEWIERYASQAAVILLAEDRAVAPLIVGLLKPMVFLLEKPYHRETFKRILERALTLDTQRCHRLAETRLIEEGVARLTPREQEILELIWEGMSNKQIALQLDLSRKTVDIHRAHIMMKLGVGSASELIRLSYVKAWGSDPTP